MLVKKLKMVRMNKRFLKRLMRNAGIQDGRSVTLEEAQLKRNEAHKECLAARKNSPKWRTDHLQGLADALAKFHDEDPKQVLKNLRHREAIRKRALRIRGLSKRQRGPKYTKLHHTVNGV